MRHKNFLNQSSKMIMVATLIFFSSCDKDDDTPASTSTITDVVVSGSNFTTLESAVLKANLQTTLSGTGPFTVFAPDDAAFAASGITTAALNSLTPTQVQNIL